MSAAQGEARDYPKPANEWTIMVFFAGDTHLSPSMTAQLKAIKDAGFQENTSVLVHYDPNERGVAVTTLEINRLEKHELLKKKEKATRIGDGRDPYVRNLLEDTIDGATKNNTAEQALRKFLNLGASDEYRAKHYMIFLVGHGVIVGNDVFLPDSNPQSGISLQQLGDTLWEFKRSIPDDSVIELIGLHSCSMSAIEVLFELKDTAKFMMATEGVSFVGSWPYRQLLKKVLLTIDNDGTDVNAYKLIRDIYGLSLYNSTDFMFSGLSADLCLCSLDRDRVDALKRPMQKLSIALKEGLKPPPDWDSTKEWRGAELIKLAHLEAQSYYQETYTDVYDFCLCLSRRCDDTQRTQKAMIEACQEVMQALEETAPDPVIVESDHFGPLYQYSHGLSVFFPWAEPIHDDSEDNILTRYGNYQFTRELGSDSWLSFLDDYFTETRRTSRIDEDPLLIEVDVSGNGTRSRALGIMAAAAGIDALPLPVSAKDSPSLAKDSPSLTKDSPSLTGGCGCSVKNYPMKFSFSQRVADNYSREGKSTDDAPTQQSGGTRRKQS